ncbi:hypothetical protein [Allofournierella sp.]|uniref:hypothetical protein n=1 Tax=Allofournierella sp. TaxID=1940256 RepID=UPI003AB553E6
MLVKKVKPLVSILLVFVITICFSGITFADDNIVSLPRCGVGDRLLVPIGDAEYIKDQNGNIIPVSGLLSFDTQQEADAFVKDLLSVFNEPNSLAVPPINLNLKSTHGDAVVATRSVAGTGSIKLHITYTTSGDGHTGVITSHSAYTSYTGFTLGFGWDESSCYSEIAASGIDIYAYAAGELTFNILVDGFIEIYREPITLSGMAAVVR